MCRIEFPIDSACFPDDWSTLAGTYRPKTHFRCPFKTSKRPPAHVPQGKGGPKVLSPISFTCFSPIFGISSIICQMSQTDLFLNANRHATGWFGRISGLELSVTDRQTDRRTTDRRTGKLEGLYTIGPSGNKYQPILHRFEHSINIGHGGIRSATNQVQ